VPEVCEASAAGAFIFSQKRRMGGIGIQGSKMAGIRPGK